MGRGCYDITPQSHSTSWVLPGLDPTAKLLCASTVAFRPGSHMSDMTPDPSVDVSDWDETNDLHTSDNGFRPTN